MTVATPPLEIYSHPSDDGVIVKISGEIDLSTTPLLWDRMNEIADQHSGHLTVDLRGVSFIDSSGLSLLIATHKSLASDGRALSTFVAPGSQPDRVLTLGRFGNLLNLSPGPTDA